MNPNKILWEKGDFTRIAATMRESGERLVTSLNLTKEMQVLDLGCGDGTTALPASRFAAYILGVDIAHNLVEAGNRRVKEAGISNCHFQEGDAVDLAGCKDQQFDRVISIFGAMFAPKPQEVANQLVRVTKPGGKIIMGNWIPGDPTLVAQILKTCSAYTPAPPEGFISPMLWGMPEKVTERFVNAGIPASQIQCEKDSFTFLADYPPSHFVHEFRHFYGPTMNAFEAAQKNGKDNELQAELVALFESQNSHPDKSKTNIKATFLRVTVNK